MAAKINSLKDAIKVKYFAPMNEFNSWLGEFIDSALREDVGTGDHSGNCCIDPEATGSMELIIKDEGILAGVEIAREVFQRIDPGVSMEIFIRDGQPIQNGQRAFQIYGRHRSMLQGERLALNIMQRMSGIATKTAAMVKYTEGTAAKILDTRKTTPNLRPLEKLAVRLGGGHNHRMGLYDMIMLKDNHIDFAGGIRKAVEKANQYKNRHGLKIPIEVETRNFVELKEVLECEGVLRVMFDNFSVENTHRAVELVNGKLETESSGGINEINLRAYAETGVDFISLGSLTYSVRSLDMSLKAMEA